jgi:alkylhydroperoxidase/carboxymuconolactone decarboxylase family protein YurZ
MSRQPADHYLKLKERHAKLIAAVEALGSAARNCGPLPDKTVHLIQLGAAAAIRSHGSTHSHAIRALEAGATPDEVRHAVIVLTSTIGFPTVAAALSWVDDVIEKF